MEPSISENSWLVTFREGFRQRPPGRFDVVRLEDPRSKGHWVIKRIVGLPGEDVALRNGELFLNNLKVEEPHAYCPDPVTDNFEWWPRDDEYVVLGDNRGASTDSRKYGPVKRVSFRSRVRT